MFLRSVIWIAVCLMVAPGMKAQGGHDSLRLKAQRAYETGEYSTAHEIYSELLKEFTRQNNQRELAATYRNMGENLRAMSSFENSLRLLDSAAKYAGIVKDNQLTGRILNRKSAVYFEMADYSKAEQMANMALDFAIKSGDKEFIPNNLNLLGAIKRIQKDYEQSIQYLESAIKAARESGDTSDIANIYNNIAKALQMMGKYEEAIRTSQIAIDIASRMGIKAYLLYGYEIQTEAYEKMGDYKSALHTNRISASYRDSLYSRSVESQVQAIDMRNEIEKSEAKNKELTETNLEQQSQIRTRNLLLFAFGLVLALAGGLVYLLLRNQTRTRMANEMLMSKNKEIEEQTQELSRFATYLQQANAEMNESKHKLESSNRMKDKLFSIISHDLRSPLNSIQGILSLVRSGSLTEEEMKSMSESLIDRVEYTSNLLDNLLTWSRSQMEGFQVHAQQMDIQEAAFTVLNQLSAMSEKKKIRLATQIPAQTYAWADPDMVEIVLRNLVANAIKFTPTGGRVEVFTEVNDREVKINVRDSGIGIKPENLARIFGGESFSTQGTSKEKGSGLGLVLCRDFVEKNHGRMYAESDPGSGSTFWFSLPLPPSGIA